MYIKTMNRPQIEPGKMGIAKNMATSIKITTKSKGVKPWKSLNLGKNRKYPKEDNIKTLNQSSRALGEKTQTNWLKEHLKRSFAPCMGSKVYTTTH